ncbi:MAG: excinuclease ABC subunit C [Acidobacteria bacterium]|nr:MAG: excinuclease ABC subunit C [Acidobacteriota bacterium]
MGEDPDEPFHGPGEGVADLLGEHARRGECRCRFARVSNAASYNGGVGAEGKAREGAVLYVGKARVLRDRVRQYFQPGRPADVWRDALVAEIADLDMVLTDTEMEALALENNFIKRHQPRFNVLLRDDKNHPYLKLTLAEEYPRLHVVRRVAEDDNAYGGPYIPAVLGRRTAALVHKIFGVRSCKETLNGRRPRPCLQYQIGRCIAPCVAEICSLDRYRRACADAALFLEGRTEEVVRRLRAAMDEAAGADRFEEAASLRDQIRTLQRLDTPQKVTTTDIEERDVFAAHVEWGRAALQVFSVREGKIVAREGYLLDHVAEPEALLSSAIPQFYAQGRYVPRELLVPAALPDRALLEEWLGQRRGTQVRIRVPQRGEKVRLMEMVARNARLAYDLEWRHPRKQSQEILRALRDLLDLEVEPRRIECFDISNIQGSDIVASMVCFEEGLPRKSEYRKFRVRGLGASPDDFAAMREVVGRRYRRLLEEGKDLPDLILIDGGPGQLSAATEALAELGIGHQPVASIAKKEEVIFVPGRAEPIVLPHSSPVLQLVQRVRDEAHRFAIGFHRKVRAQRTLRSELDDIPGVGPAKRRKLLSRFGSLRGVRGASLADLATAVGAAMAARIRQHLERR